MSKLTREEAMVVIRAHGAWVRAAQVVLGTNTEESAENIAYEGLLALMREEKIRDFWLDDRGIVWNEEDEEEYGMLSNIVHSLENKPNASVLADNKSATAIWSKKLLKEFHSATVMSNSPGENSDE